MTATGEGRARRPGSNSCLVRLRLLEAQHPGAVEKAVREFEREAVGQQPDAREAIALVRACFGLRAPR